MLRFHPPQWTLLVLASTVVTHAVDIRIERSFVIAGEAESFVAAVCLNVQPGECCKPPIRYPDVTTKVLFRHLLAWDIAAVWRDENRFEMGVAPSHTGCSGPLITSKKGPGVWLWRQPPTTSADSHASQGASYIRLPLNLPPNPKAFNDQVMQGLLALVWSSGSWFASPAAEKVFGGQYELKVGAQRDIRSPTTGNVYAQPPLRTMYPDFLEINGTQYNAEQARDLQFSNGDGEVLDLTDWFTGVGY